MRYRKGAGSIDHVATIISELAERMDGKRLLSIATRGEEIPIVQRLGYLLERTGHADLAGCVPYFERVINCNLTRLGRLLRILRFTRTT